MARRQSHSKILSYTLILDLDILLEKRLGGDRMDIQVSDVREEPKRYE